MGWERRAQARRRSRVEAGTLSGEGRGGSGMRCRYMHYLRGACWKRELGVFDGDLVCVRVKLGLLNFSSGFFNDDYILYVSWHHACFFKELC